MCVPGSAPRPKHECTSPRTPPNSQALYSTLALGMKWSYRSPNTAHAGRGRGSRRVGLRSREAARAQAAAQAAKYTLLPAAPRPPPSRASTSLSARASPHPITKAIATHSPVKGLAVASIRGRLGPADLRPRLQMGRLLSTWPGPCNITPKGRSRHRPASPPLHLRRSLHIFSSTHERLRHSGHLCLCPCMRVRLRRLRLRLRLRLLEPHPLLERRERLLFLSAAGVAGSAAGGAPLFRRRGKATSKDRSLLGALAGVVWDGRGW